MTFSIMIESCYAESLYAEFHNNPFMLSVVMLNVIILSVMVPNQNYYIKSMTFHGKLEGREKMAP